MEATSKIVSTHKRVSALNRRLTADQSDDVESTLRTVRDATTTKKKGKNAVMGRSRLEHPHSELVSEVQGQTACGSYLILSDDELILKTWEDLYLLAAHGVAPTSWSRTFQDDVTIGSEVKVKAEMCS